MKISRYFYAISLILMTALLLNQVAIAKGLQADPSFGERFEMLGINTKAYDASSAEKFLTFLLEVQTRYEQTESLAEHRSALDYAVDKLAEMKNLRTQAELAHNYFEAVRIYYSVVGGQALEDSYHTDERRQKFNTYVDNADLNEPVGKRAKKEATNLMLGDDYASVEELEKLSPKEISELDINESHMAWFTQAQIKANGPNYLEKLEAWAEKKTSSAITKGKGDLDYKFREAKRVVFVDHFKGTATSAKMNTTDNYGVRWKLKWGTEINTEPMGNCLAIKAGAKMTDFVFSNTRGKEGLTLILDDPQAKNKDGEPSPIRSYSELVQAAMDSLYKFNITSHIYSHGVITASNMNQVLKYLPENAYVKKTKAELIGRTYVTFKASMVEFKGEDGNKRVGPIATSQAGALSDRVARGLLAFNMWIWNGDTKDDNSRGALVDDLYGDRKYVEYIHDLGTAFANPVFKGNPNKLEFGDDFMYLFETRRGSVRRTRRSNNMSKPDDFKIRFSQFSIYGPKAFDETTVADLRWGTQKVVNINEDDIRQCAERAGQTDFWVEAYVNRLMSRRATMAHYLEIEIPESEKDKPVETMTIPLETAADRVAAAKRYGITVEEINTEMKGLGLLESDSGISSYKEDIVLKPKGSRGGEENIYKMADCENTVMMGLLVAVKHSSGIERRLMPREDKNPLDRCALGKKPQDSGHLGRAFGGVFLD